MAAYRVPEFTLEQRVEAVLQMLVPGSDRPWGLVSELTRLYGVSRTRLYELRDEAWEAIVAALQPGQAGRPGQETHLTVDKAFIDRTIAILPMLTGSVRDIRLGLKLILGVSRSVGYVSETLSAAGEQAKAYNLRLTVPLPILGEADEIFQGRKPCLTLVDGRSFLVLNLTPAGEQAKAYNLRLTVPLPILGEADEIFQGRKPCLTLVDGRSFLVLNLTPAEARDGTTWGLTYLDLVERGIQFQDLACDGGTGLRAGVRQAKLAVPLRPDLFHLLQEAYHLTRRLEGAAYRAIETAERARRADLEARGLRRRCGRRLKIKVPLAQAQVEETQAIETFDTWSWLLAEVRQALEPISPTHHLVSVTQTKATLETAIALLKELGHADLTAFATDLQQKLPELLAPLEWLEQHLAPVLKDLAANIQAFVLWTWQHRQTLALNLETDFPAALRSIGSRVWETLGLFHRSSSLAESLHSWLRPHLQIHRGMPRWLLPLLQLFWNHHEFERGKRVGHSPLELAGVPNPPSLAEVLDQLFRPRETTQPG